ncbi:antitoxin HipB [Moraxella lacunata]|nr:helix-turn-helix transcriptional regulator [Moraxella lacunata]STZ01221.1 antitoxin HipB [Moraxella lacunata]
MKLTNFDDFFGNLPKDSQERVNERVADTLVSIRLSELRKNAKLTQAELADKIGVSQSAICQMESADNPEYATIKKYVQALGGKLIVEIDGKQSVLFG